MLPLFQEALRIIMKDHLQVDLQPIKWYDILFVASMVVLWVVLVVLSLMGII